MVQFKIIVLLLAIVGLVSATKIAPEVKNTFGTTLASILNLQRANKTVVTQVTGVTLIQFGEQYYKSEAYDEILRQVRPNRQYTFNVVNGHFKGFDQLRSHITVVILEPAETNNYIRWVFKRHLPWFIKQDNIFGIATKPTNVTKFRADTYEFFQNSLVLNVLLVDLYSRKPKFLKFTPFNKTSFYKELKEIRLYEDIFSNSVNAIRNLNRFELNVIQRNTYPRSSFKNGTIHGIDGNYLMGFLDHLNGTYKLIDQLEGPKFEVHIMTYLASYIAHGSFNELPMHTGFSKAGLSHSYPYEWEKFCFVLPKPPRHTSIWNIFLTFDRDTWILMAMVFVCYVILRHLSKSLEVRINQSIEDVEFNESLWTVMEIHLTSSTFMQFKTLFDRIFITLLLFYSFLMLEYFNGNIVAMMLMPVQDGILTTPEMVFAQNQTIVTDPFAFTTAKEIFGDSIPDISMFKLMAAKDHSFDYDGKDIYLLPEIEANAILTNRQNYMADGEQRWYQVEQCLMSIPKSYFFPPASLFRPIFDDFAARMRESGIHQHWEDQMKDMLKNGSLLARQLEKPEIVTHAEFQQSFYILFTGLLISTAVFVLEVVGHRVQGYLVQRFLITPSVQRTINV